MDSALRMNLSEALSDKLDQQILNGDEGLLNGTNLANHNVSAAFDYICALSLADWPTAALTEPTRRTSISDIRIVCGAATYGDMAAQVPQQQRGRPCGRRRPAIGDGRLESFGARSGLSRIPSRMR